MPTDDQPTAVDPSMEDILASIRRILNEEEVKPAEHSTAADDVLVLEPSMMVSAPVAAPPVPAPSPAPEPVAEPAMIKPPSAPAFAPAVTSPPAFTPTPQAVLAPIPMPESIKTHIHDEPLVDPVAAAAAAGSVGALLQTLAQERGAAVSRSGPTIEDLVRDEMRPMLKEWLDTHLPPIVERLVRAEIERVVSRTS